MGDEAKNPPLLMPLFLGLAPPSKNLSWCGGVLRGTDTFGFLGGGITFFEPLPGLAPWWNPEGGVMCCGGDRMLMGDGNVRREASVLSVASSLMVSMMDRVLTPDLSMTSAIFALQEKESERT